MRGPSSRYSLHQIWRWPLMLAALVVFGLLSALLDQGGIWWGLSWIALAVPLGTVTGCIIFRRKTALAPVRSLIREDDLPKYSPGTQ
jgi:hypothetical protein